MAADPAFASTPARVAAQVTTADTSRTAPSNVVTVLTADTNGTKISEVVIHCTAAITVAGMVRLFIYDGTNYRLYDEIPIPVDTVGANDPAYRVAKQYQNLVLKSGQSLRATTEKTDTINIHVEAANL